MIRDKSTLKLAILQSTHSKRSATFSSLIPCNSAITSIHALQAECDSVRCSAIANSSSTSIHALQAECDCFTKFFNYFVTLYFNPRTPSGVRHQTIDSFSQLTLLQSTHSKRSATLCATSSVTSLS